MWMLPRLLVLAALTLAGCTPPEFEEQRPLSGEPPAQEAAVRTAAEPPGTSSIEIRVLDVGQGDGILIRSLDADGRAAQVALIDAGPADRIVRQLRDLDVTRIDLLVASHNHADHIGGMDAVLDSIPVRFYLDNGHPATTRIQQRVLERIERRGVTYLQPGERTIAVGAAQLRVIPAPSGVPGDEQNNRSLTLLLEYGDFRALFPGDAETALLNALLAAGAIPQVDVLKASHHGSRNGVTPGWIARTRPSLVAISVGDGNSYGHPHAGAMRYYCTGGRQVLRTDQHGDIVVRVDAAGNRRIQTARGGEVGAESPQATQACAAYSADAGTGGTGRP